MDNGLTFEQGEEIISVLEKVYGQIGSVNGGVIYSSALFTWVVIIGVVALVCFLCFWLLLQFMKMH